MEKSIPNISSSFPVCSFHQLFIKQKQQRWACVLRRKERADLQQSRELEKKTNYTFKLSKFGFIVVLMSLAGLALLNQGQNLKL